MNIANFHLTLQSAINNATTTIDYLFLSKAIESLNVGQLRTVDTFTNLPNASTNTGLLVFVTTEETLYWSTGNDWLSIISTGENITYSWGSNALGQLGDNTSTNRSSPVSVVGEFNDWSQVSTGNQHSLGIRTNSTAWAWGNNSSGQLGDGTTTTRSSPVSVVGGFTDWFQVSAGCTHSLAITTNGTAWAWGQNSYGQLGDNSTTNKSSPVSVVNILSGFSDWCQVSAGGSHSLGVRTNGTMWTWGNNSSGQLGDGTTTTRSSPVSVVGGFTDWFQVSAGCTHSLAITTNGTAWAWGQNSYGQLGDGTTTSRSSPVNILGGFTHISAGFDHSLGVRTDGTAWAWGNNSNGQLGDNTAISKSIPVSVVGGFTDWCQVSAGDSHSLGVRTDGTAWAWGNNSYGRLGDGTATSRSSPVSVVGGFTNWCQVSAGGNHSFGIRLTSFQ
jgi:alpha-tubulin suppressor-like RCC1 family protein